MGLCREKLGSSSVENRDAQKVWPVDQCVEHQANIKTCVVEEGKNYPDLNL